MWKWQTILMIRIITIAAAAITIYLCYDEHKNGKMSSKNFKIAAVCEGLAIDNPAITLFLKHGFVEEYWTGEKIILKKEL